MYVIPYGTARTGDICVGERPLRTRAALGEVEIESVRSGRGNGRGRGTAKSALSPSLLCTKYTS